MPSLPHARPSQAPARPSQAPLPRPHARPSASLAPQARPSQPLPRPHARPSAFLAPQARPLPSALPGLLASALLALSACSLYQLGPAPADPLAVTRPFTPYIDSMATVCAIRTSRLALAVTFVVHDNDLLVGATRGPTYFCWRAQPGAHDIVVHSEDGGQRFAVTLVERGRYYLDQGLDYRLGFVTPRGRWVDEHTALALLQQSDHRVLLGAPARESLLLGTNVAAARR